MNTDPAQAARQVIGGARRLPIEAYDRIRGRIERARQPPGAWLHPNRLDALDVAHELTGAGTCYDCVAELESVRHRMQRRLREPHWLDGGDTLSTFIWAVVRHARPEIVVETGVARGVSSAFVLEAMARNDAGHLWSIDLPPRGAVWGSPTGAAVAPELYERWTYVRGISRRQLPEVLQQVGVVDVFLHDSLHTVTNMLFEFRNAWPRLGAKGFLVADDAHFNDSILRFGAAVNRQPMLLGERTSGHVVAVLARSGITIPPPLERDHAG
jgi:hypothetical protein